MKMCFPKSGTKLQKISHIRKREPNNFMFFCVFDLKMVFFAEKFVQLPKKTYLCSMKRIFILLSLILSLSAWAGWQPSVFNFSPKQYGAGTQNWQIEQAPSGWIYVANNYGLMVYDGVEWRLQGIHNSTILHALHIADDGSVYVGGRGEFGCFHINEYGEMSYTVLSDNVPEAYRSFGEVWKIHECDGRLCFQTRQYVFLTDTTGEHVEVLNPGAVIYSSLQNEQNLYLATDRGVYLYSGGRLHLLSGSQLLAGKIISCMAALDDDRILIGTDFDGVYVCEAEGTRRAKTEANEFLCRNQLYSIAVCHGYVAYGTVLQGLVLTDPDGKVLRHYDRRRGLQNNTILSICFDRDGSLWIGEDMGIDQIPLLSPTEYLLGSEALGVGYTYAEYQGVAYLGTNQGLYRQDGDEFVLIPGSLGQVWRLREIDGDLFCCHNRGLMLVRPEEVELLDVKDGVWNVLRQSDGHVLVCSYAGLYKLERCGDSYRTIIAPSGYNETMFYSAIDANDHVWTTSGKGIVHLIPDSLYSTVAQVKILDDEKFRVNCAVAQVDESVLVCSDRFICEVTDNGELCRSSEWESRVGCDKYTMFLHSPYGWVTASSNGIFLNGQELFVDEGFFNAGFENIALSADSQYVVVGGTDGFYRISLQRSLQNPVGVPWVQCRHRVFVPWYNTWYMWVIYSLVLAFTLLALMMFFAAAVQNRDERLAREREAEIQHQQMRILQLEKDKAQYELEERGRKLNNALLGKVNRNEIIAWVQEDVRRITDCLQREDTEQAKKLLRQLQGKLSAGNRRQDGDWKHFEDNFNEVNENFVVQLRKLYPWMSPEEHKLCMYIYMGLQTKEIGPLLHLSTRGVEMMRYRMRKQMNLPAQTNLKTYFESLQ